MPSDTEMEELLDIVRNGTPFEALRAARQLERLTRKQRCQTPIDIEMDELLDIAKHGTPFEGLRAAKQINQLMRKRRLEREQVKEKEKAAATK